VKLSNSFDIDRPAADVFDIFLDIERVATCMPGSRLTGQVDEDTYEGEVKIKVGPMTVAYAGQATFVDIDKDARRLTLRAKGRETRGAGGADAMIVAQLHEQGRGTRVNIATDLSIRGKVAQFGRGAIGEVAGGLMQQFAHNVEALLSGQASAARPAGGAASPHVQRTLAAAATATVDPGEAALDVWGLVVLPLVRKALPSVANVLASGAAAYLGARLALHHAPVRGRHRGFRND